jgi:Uma2 family endonuclease
MTVAIPLAEFGKSLGDADLDAWFESFSERNSNEGQTYAISGTGFLLIMPPTGDPGSFFENEIATDLTIWSRRHGGFVRGPTARFILPDGSRYGPDASWVSEERRDEVLQGARPFSHLVPDFIVEVQSPSNGRPDLIDKINMFISYGTKLAWLMDADERVVIKFRPDQGPEVLYDPEFVDGDEDVLPGFRFAVRTQVFDYFTNPV